MPAFAATFADVPVFVTGGLLAATAVMTGVLAHVFVVLRQRELDDARRSGNAGAAYATCDQADLEADIDAETETQSDTRKGAAEDARVALKTMPARTARHVVVAGVGAGNADETLAASAVDWR
jgi:hypothetical protein